MTSKVHPVRSIHVSVDVPGTPEQVWQAIATGRGIATWFVPTDVEEREGGKIVFHLGPDMDSEGRVTVWQPTNRFGYEERDWSEGAPPLATELTIEAQAGGTCRLRLVSSLFTESHDWDNELESMKKGWVPFFEVLRLYLRDFAGLPALNRRWMRTQPADQGRQPNVWQAFLRNSRLEGAGQRLELRMPDAEALKGEKLETPAITQEHATILVRLTDPAPGIAVFSSGTWGGNVHLTCDLYFYGEHAAQTGAAHESTWRAWFDALPLS